MADLASQAFGNRFTYPHGSSFFVSVEPVFDEQITEAVTLIARSRPENVRVSYISQFTAAAKAASPTPEVVEPVAGEEEEEEDDEDKEEKKVEEDSEEIKAAKRKVVKDLVSSIKNLRLEGSDKEFEGFSNLILSLILSLFDASHTEFSTLFFILTDAVMFNAERTANPSLSARYTAVATIFNSLPAAPSALRLTTLIKLIEFAAANDDFSVIHPALANFESWLVEWGFAVGTVGEEEGNRAVLSIANTLSSRNQQTLARTLILSRLSAPSAVAGKSATPSVSGATLASHLIVLSLSLTENFDFSTLYTLPYVASPSVPALASLLDIFQAGDVAAFQTFASTNETMLKEQGLEVAALEKKLKLLALAELCSKKVGESVSYKEIAEALKVKVAADDDGEAVEIWVIDAIRASLISGRLSQPLLSFHVTRAAPRTFTPAHWSQLQSRLEGWKSSLDGILDSVSKGLQIDGGNGMGAVEVREHHAIAA